MKRPLATSSLVLLLAASPAFGADAPSAATDSQGNEVHGTGGSCIGSTSGSGKKMPGCTTMVPRQTFRILQGMIPQPYATYAPAPPTPVVETLQIALKQPWENGSAMLSPTQREELYSVMTQLEGYRRVEAFDVVIYQGTTKDPKYNRLLADKRAGAMTSFLASVGIPLGQITTRIADAAGAAGSGMSVTVRGRR